MSESTSLLDNPTVYNTKRKTSLVAHIKSLVIVLLVAFVIYKEMPEKTVKPSGKKNIIFMVTDGMGPASVSLARSFKQFRDDLDVGSVLAIDRHFIGSSRTRSSSSLVTDSAAGATAFSCGLKSYNGAIGVSPDQEPCGTILEALKLQGYMTGLVVTTRITDATPAAFSSHVDYRFQEDLIAQHQLGEYPLGRMVDLIIGGGRCHFLPVAEGGCRADSRNLIKEYTGEDGEWSYVGDRAQFDQLNGGKNVSLPLLGLIANTDIPYDIDRNPKEYPSLAEQVKVALTALTEATKDSEEGFFLLIEGLRIDHCSHSNDAQCEVREILAYDEAYKEVLSYIYQSDVETVAILTSDHETGGLVTARQVSENYPDYLWYPEVLLNCTHSGEFLARKIYQYQTTTQDSAAIESFLTNEIIQSDMGILDAKPEEIQLLKDNLSDAGKLLQIVNNMVSVRSQTGWTTHGHSAVDVNIYGFASEFGTMKDELLKYKTGLAGNHENIEIGQFMEKVTGVSLSKVTKMIKDTVHHPEVAIEQENTQHDEYYHY